MSPIEINAKAGGLIAQRIYRVIIVLTVRLTKVHAEMLRRSVIVEKVDSETAIFADSKIAVSP